MGTAVQTGLNMLQVGALRIPFLFANMNGALLVGEGTFRLVKGALHLTTGFTGENIRKHLNDKIVRVVRPYQSLNNKDLAFSALFCCVIGILGSEAVTALFGRAPPIYNQVLTWLGNIRIDVDHHHPLIQMALARLKR